MLSLSDMATQPVAEWSLEMCKARQRVIRYKITGSYNRINNIVTKRLSRRDAKKHLAEARGLLGDMETIHDRIVKLLDDDGVVIAQNTRHLTYASTVDGASSLVENYVLLR